MKINVIKRDGNKIPLDFSKIQKASSSACEGITNVSSSMVEINAQIQFYDGIKTSDIQKLLIKSATNLILDEQLGHVNYQYVAGRLLLQDIRKRVYKQYEPLALYDIVKNNIKSGVYTEELLKWYTEEEWHKINLFVKHDRDEDLAISQLDQFVEKYLVQNRSTGTLYETPQIRYIIAAATKFHAEKENRLKWIKSEYDCASTGEFTYATPQLAGLGTPTKQFSSCVVIRSDDNLDSIYAAGEVMGKYAAKRAGIGFEFGRLRPKGSVIRNGEVKHTGHIGFLKKWFGDLRACSQGGIRNASACFYYPIWHKEFQDLIVLKNNQGTDETRIRHLDYGIVVSGYFLKRLKENREITFFDPNEVPNLYEAYYRDPDGEFVELYEKYEKSKVVKNKLSLSAETVWKQIIKERTDTGRIYLMFIDNVSKQGPYNTLIDPIYSSNLCNEILLPTKSFNSINDENGRVALCTLGSVNLGKFKNPQDMEKSIRLLVHGLVNVLNYQDFLFEMSRLHNEEYCPLGIGITNLAYWLAKRGFKYGQPEALQELKVWMEHISYYAIKESVELAKIYGKCKNFDQTKWAKGIFPWELRKDGVNELADFFPSVNLDWESLRQDVIKYGMKNVNLLAVAPVESSSVVIGGTNGGEPVKELILFKDSKTSGSLIQVAPEYDKLKNKYELLWDVKCNDYLKTIAIIAAYVDQSISTNTFYNPSKFENGIVPIQVVIKDIFNAYNWGIKTLYYALIKSTGNMDALNEDSCESCKL